MTKRVNISMEISQLKDLEKIGVSNLSKYIRRLIDKDIKILERFIEQLKEKGFDDYEIEQAIERMVN